MFLPFVPSFLLYDVHVMLHDDHKKRSPDFPQKEQRRLIV